MKANKILAKWARIMVARSKAGQQREYKIMLEEKLMGKRLAKVWLSLMRL